VWERLLHCHNDEFSPTICIIWTWSKKCCFWCCQKKNSTPSCTMTSGPRSNASGELVQITPKPSSSGGQTACDWEKCPNQIVEPRMFPLLQNLQEDCGHVPRFSTFTFYHESWVLPSASSVNMFLLATDLTDQHWSKTSQQVKVTGPDFSTRLWLPFFLRTPTSRMQ